MAAPVNNPDDNVAISSARVVRILLDSETFLVDPSRPNIAHPIPFDSLVSCSTPYRNDGSEATGAHRRLLVQDGLLVLGPLAQKVTQKVDPMCKACKALEVPPLFATKSLRIDSRTLSHGIYVTASEREWAERYGTRSKPS